MWFGILEIGEDHFKKEWALGPIEPARQMNLRHKTGHPLGFEWSNSLWLVTIFFFLTMWSMHDLFTEMQYCWADLLRHINCWGAWSNRTCKTNKPSSQDRSPFGVWMTKLALISYYFLVWKCDSHTICLLRCIISKETYWNTLIVEVTYWGAH